MESTSPFGKRFLDNDALEAYKTFRWARGWFFWIALLAMITILGVFLAVTLGVAHPTPAEGEAVAAEAPAQLVRALNGTLGACNNLIFFCLILYCVTLLVGTNFAIVGRLGGLQQLARAFFYSLLPLFLILPLHPWQDGQAMGVLYGFADLNDGYELVRKTGLGFDVVTVGYFVRFFGLPLIVLVLHILTALAGRRAWQQVRHRANARLNQSILPSATGPMITEADSAVSLADDMDGPTIPLS